MDLQWRFAIDCVTGGRVSALSDASDLNSRLVFNALNYGLSYSRHDAPVRRGYVSTAEARAVMAAWGSDEPNNPAAQLATFMQPHPCKPEGQSEHWPINRARDQCPELAIWGMILAIERGWFDYDRSGFLQWSQAGRDRYDAGPSGTVMDSTTGQGGFGF